MPEEVKQSLYKKRKESGLKPITVWVSSKLMDDIKIAAKSVNEPVTSWSKRAILGTLSRWKAPGVDKTVWPKCSLCGKHHNEEEHWGK